MKPQKDMNDFGTDTCEDVYANSNESDRPCLGAAGSDKLLTNTPLNPEKAAAEVCRVKHMMRKGCTAHPQFPSIK